MKVLVTAGGTAEPLDGVRRLSNTSTGATGLAIARAFSAGGAEVFLLHAEGVDPGGAAAGTESFQTFDDLAASLRRLLGSRRFDAVVHLAAVGDYRLVAIELDGQRVENGRRGKLGTGGELLLRLAPNPKLIDRLRGWSLNPDLAVVGFKLTDDPDPHSRAAQARALLQRGVADLVVHNDISEIDHDRHRARIYDEHGMVEEISNKNELARALLRLLRQGVAA